MKNFRLGLGFGLLSTILSCVAGIGCGSGSGYANPTTAVAKTANPLVAQYSVTQPHKGSSVFVEFGTDTSYGRQTATTAATDSFGQMATVLVAGMKANTTYHMRAHVQWNGTDWVDQDRTFTTGAIPSSFLMPGITVTPTNLTPNPGIEMMDLVAESASDTLDVFATDLSGNVIWYYDIGAGNFAAPVKIIPNGDIIMGIGATSPVLREIDLAGNTVREVSNTAMSQQLQALGYTVTLNGFHHDLAILPNGHFIILANMYVPYTNLPGYPGVTNVLGDVLIDLDPNWNPVWFWSTFDHLDINRHLMGLPDWTHSNAILYDSHDGNLILSMRHQSWVIKIDYQNGSGAGDILWHLGEDGDFTLTPNDPAQWFYAEHFPAIVSQSGSQTTLSVMDNGNLRLAANPADDCTSNYTANADCYSRAAIFQFDESAKTASVVWQDSPGGLFSFFGGNTLVLPNNHVEFDLCSPFGLTPGSQVMEVTQETVPQTVWQMNVNGDYAYRALRTPSLYPGVTWTK